MTAAKGLSKKRLRVIAVQEVRWDKSGTESEDNYNFTMVKGMDLIYCRHNFL
jgi:hypothetical protein